MTPLAFAIPGDLALPTGGYRYDREVLARLPAEGVAPQHLALPGSYPAPDDAALAATAEALAAVPATVPLLVDGLALGAMPPALVAPHARRLIALVHHPLGLEAGLPPERAAFLLANERAVLALARAVVVTSAATGRTLARDFGVPPERLTVAEPGTTPAARSRGGGGVPHLLAVGAVSPRKAYDLLVRALAPLADRPWRLTIAGKTDLSPEGYAALRAAMAETGLATRVTLTGAVSDEALAALYDHADAFVMASLYEGYGMALTEALARGLPIVTSTGGAAAETVPDAAALKVPPGDEAALTAALATLLDDGALRARLAEAAWAAAERLPRWQDTAARIARVVHMVARNPSAEEAFPPATRLSAGG